jgi:4-amino-4-deoxy-L-arabinose transferase-like glycosyltransferase
MPARTANVRWMAAVIVAAGGLYLLAASRMHLWDRDEPRYAQTSRRMVQSGDWVVPWFLDHVRYAKPVFIYWCQATSMSLLREQSPWAARLPSALAMVLTLAVIGAALRRWAGPEHAFWTVAILASSLLAISAATMCLTDAVLSLWITLAQGAMYLIWTQGVTWGRALAMGAAVGLAILTKGPVVLGVMGATLGVLGLMRWARWGGLVAEPSSRPSSQPSPQPSPGVPGEGGEGGEQGARCALTWLAAVALVVAICAPWAILVEQRSPGFFAKAFSHDVMRRIGEGLEGHSGPPGYYLLTVWGMYLPWSLFLPAAIIGAIRNRAQPLVRFALAAVIGPWVMFEIVQTKLPHYLLPAYPWLAWLTADALVRYRRGQSGAFAHWSLRVGAGIWAVAIVLGGLLPWLATGWFDDLPYVAMAALSAVAMAYAAAVFILIHRRRLPAAAGTMAGGFAVLVAVLLAWYVPGAHFMRLPERLADVLRREGAVHPGDAVMTGYKEHSLAFYQGGTIREESDDGFLSHTPPSQWPGWIVLPRPTWLAMDGGLRKQWEQIAVERGWSYADKLRIVEVVVIRRRRADPATGAAGS